MTGFVAEAYARERVPDSQLGSARRIFFIVTGSLCGLPVLVLATRVATDLGTARSRGAFVVGGLVSGVLGAFSAYSGAKSRLNLAMLSEQAFGWRGSKLVKLVISTCLIGWVGVILSVLGSTASDALGSIVAVNASPAFISCCAAIIVAMIVLRGVGGLEKVGLVIAPLLAVLLGISLARGCPGAALTVASRPSVMGFGNAVSAVIGMYIVGIVVQPDYGRFIRVPIAAAATSALALGAVYPCILAFSAMPATKCGAPDLISALMLQGLGIPALTLLLLGAWIDASVSLYSGSLSLTNQLRVLKRRWVVAGATGFACLLVLLRADQHLVPFLEALSIALPPVAAIQVLNGILGRAWERNTEARVSRPIRWLACLAWLSGSLAGFASHIGIASMTGVAAIDSILVGAVVFLAGEALIVSRLGRRVAVP